MMIAMFVINIDHTDEDDPDIESQCYVYLQLSQIQPLDNFGRPCS